MHRAACKQFGRGDGKGGGQFDHGVRAAFDRVPCALVFVEDGRLPALGEIPAHDAEHFVAAGKPARFGKLVPVSVVKGVIFANYRTKFHVFSLVSFTIIAKRCIMAT